MTILVTLTDVDARCGRCSSVPLWRIDGYGDRGPSWACPDHLSEVCDTLLREHKWTTLTKLAIN